MGEKLRVVIVEDEPILLRYVTEKTVESDSDIEVVLATQSSEEALQYMRGCKPDILLTDIEMPGINGINLIREAKGLYKELYVVIISGYSNFSYAQSAIRYGVTDYLLKPIEYNLLKETLQKIKRNIVQERRQSDWSAVKQKTDQEIASQLQTLTEQKNIAMEIEQYIVLRFNQPMSISDISRHFSYTPSYINRIFKKQYGFSPIQYQIQLRINKSKELLKEMPEVDIQFIAAAVGYEDSRYFSRIFRRIEGIAPSEFARGG